MFSIAIAALLAANLGCRSPSDRAEKPASEPKSRLVCLTPSSTEAVLTVASPQVIVGVDKYSKAELGAVARHPSVGDFISPSMEAILRLDPDLVVLDADQTKVIDGLEAAGIDTLPLRMKMAGDVTEGIRRVGEALGRTAEADEAIARIESDIAAVKKFAAEKRGDGPAPRVLFIIDREMGGLGNLIAAGPDTYIDELIETVGGVNVLHDSPVAYPRISVEEVITRAPEVILDAVHTKELQRASSDWDVLSTVPAVQRGRVHVLGDTKYTHPTPRLGETLRGIAERVCPAAARKPPVRQELANTPPLTPMTRSNSVSR